MKYFYKISSIVATVALVMGLSFSASFAQNMQTQQSQSQSNTLKGKVVSSQSNQAVSNATVKILQPKNNKNNNTYQNRTKQDTTNQYNANNENNTNKNQSAMKTVKTDQNGHFKIKNVPSGTYMIKVKADGYQTWTKQKTIKKDASLNIKLKQSR